MQCFHFMVEPVKQFTAKIKVRHVLVLTIIVCLICKHVVLNHLDTNAVDMKTDFIPTWLQGLIQQEGVSESLAGRGVFPFLLTGTLPPCAFWSGWWFICNLPAGNAQESEEWVQGASGWGSAVCCGSGSKSEPCMPGNKSPVKLEMVLSALWKDCVPPRFFL